MADAAAAVKVRVKSASVSLDITLTDKFLAMPLSKALVNPFIKAYNKKAATAVSSESLASVHISGGACPDGMIPIATLTDEKSPSSMIIGAAADGVNIELTFQEQTMPIFTEGMTEVEKLKAKRRAENAAKRAAAEADGTADTEKPASAPPPVQPAAPPPAEAGALGQIGKAEAKAEALAKEIEACTAGLAAADLDGAALDALSKRAAACGGVVGQLQSMMDEIDLGELEDDEVRSAARARRKAVNARVEGTLEPAKGELNAAIKAARAKLG